MNDEEIEFNHNHRYLIRAGEVRTAGWDDDDMSIWHNFEDEPISWKAPEHPNAVQADIQNPLNFHKRIPYIYYLDHDKIVYGPPGAIHAQVDQWAKYNAGLLGPMLRGAVIEPRSGGVSKNMLWEHQARPEHQQRVEELTGLPVETYYDPHGEVRKF